MRALNVLRLRDEGLVVIRKSRPPEDWRRIVVFDLDGVLVDPSERLERALELAGIEPPVEDLPEDERRKRRFFSEFFSPESLMLDKPIEETLKMLEYRLEDGDYLAVVSGRPEALIEASARSLDELGIEWHMLVHRAKGNKRLEGLLKAHALRKLLPRAYEYHDDKLENLVLVDSASLVARMFRHTSSFWYNVPGRALISEWARGRIIVDSARLAVHPLLSGYPAKIRWMTLNTKVRNAREAAKIASRITVLRGIFRRHAAKTLEPRPPNVVTVWVNGVRWRLPIELMSIGRTLGLRL